MNPSVNYIGMDLGTFKTAIASSSGARAVVQTAVGWPKDAVARTMLGADVVYGDDVNEQRLALNVVRPFYKGGFKYLNHDAVGVSQTDVEQHKEAARLLVKHAVSQVEPVPGKPVYGVIGAPSRANDENLDFLLEVAEEAFDAALIVPEPFTIAYGMGRLSSTLVVDIGAGTTDLCVLSGTYPTAEEQLTIPFGGDAIDERFLALMREYLPAAQLSLNMARVIKEKHGFVHDLDEEVCVELPADGVPTQFNVTRPLKEACMTLVSPIVEGIKKLVSSHDPEFQQPLLKQVLVGGGGSQLNGLGRLLEAGLEPLGGGKVSRVYDSVFAGAAGALKLAMSISDEEWRNMRQSKDTKAA